MKKLKNIIFICVIIFVLIVPMSVSAEGMLNDYDLPRVVDNADLLSDSDEAYLSDKISTISEEYDFDIVIVTTNTTDGKTSTEYADDYFDYNGYGAGTNNDGILLLVSMEDRDWHISTTGYGIEVFTDDNIDYIGDSIVSYLGDGNYSQAFDIFLGCVDEYLAEAAEYEAYYDEYDYIEDDYIEDDYIEDYYNHDLPRVVDNADLLSDSEEAYLSDEIYTMYEKYDFDVVIVTTNTIDGKTPMEYADDYFDYNGYGVGTNNDGILLLVSMEDRDWHISTTGYGIEVFTDDNIDYIGDSIVSYLGDGNYSQAFSIFLECVDDFLVEVEPYDAYYYEDEDYSIAVLIGMGIGLVTAIVVVRFLKSKMKSVVYQKNANNYLKGNSLNIRNSNDIFLYKTVTKTRKPEPSSSGGSSTHSGSSGTTHGGGGGKF